jgi:hypothetical protein
MMPEVPNLSAFAINMQATFLLLLQDEDLSKVSSLLVRNAAAPHIYFIVSRPRITIDLPSVRATSDHLEGSFVVHRGSGQERFPFAVQHPKEGPIERIESLWPYTNLKLLRGSDIAYWGKAALFASMFVRPYPAAFDLEVLYVGQAYGSERDRDATQRLQAHSTLQKILGEASRLQPDKEVWLVLCEFSPLLFTVYDGPLANKHPERADEDEERTNRMLAMDLPMQLQINFTEAALIRYFDPPFNTMLRKSFPSPAHKSYRECYDLDLDAVVFEIETERIYAQLWSRSRPPKWTHVGFFPLHDPRERKTILDALLPWNDREHETT